MRELAQLSFFFLRRSFFELCSRPGLSERIRSRRQSAVATAHEWGGPVEYSGFWLSVREIAGPTFLPPSPSSVAAALSAAQPQFRRQNSCHYNDWLLGNRIQLQQRNCSGFAPDFSRRSTDQTRKELPEQYRLAL